MNIQETHSSQEAYRIFKNEMDSRLGGGKERFSESYSSIFEEAIPQAFSVTKEEKRESARAMILGFFQACYTFKEHDSSPATREKARLIFNEIFQQCEKAKKPELYLQSEMYNTLMQCLDPLWSMTHYETKNFADVENFRHFEECYQYAERQLKACTALNLDRESLNQLTYYLGMLGAAQAYPYPSNENLIASWNQGRFQNPSSFSQQAIDEIIIVLSTHPDPISLLTEFLETLDILKVKCSKYMQHYEAGEVKHELLATIFNHVLREDGSTPLTSALLEQRMKAVKALIQDESLLSNQIDEAAGTIICANVARRCEPQQAIKYFNHMQTLAPNLSDRDNIQAFIKVLVERSLLSSAEVKDIERVYDTFLKNHSPEEARGMISSYLLYKTIQYDLAKHLQEILYAKMKDRDLESFYSYDLDYIAREAYDKISKTLSLFLIEKKPETYLHVIDEQVENFNEARGEGKSKLKLSEFEFYQIATAELNHLLMQMSAIQEPIVFTPIGLSTSREKVTRLLEAGLQQAGLQPDFAALKNQAQQPVEAEKLQGLLNDALQKQLREKEWLEKEEAKQKDIQNLSQMFDEKGQVKKEPLTDKQVVVSIGEDFKRQLINVDLAVGMTLEEAKQEAKQGATKKTNQTINEQSYQQVEQVVDGIKGSYNDVASQKLFDEMQKDPQIKLDVFRKFEENWRSGDRSLFGADVQKGGLLTEQTREVIIKEARHLSTQVELTAALEGFKRRLSRDLSAGAVVPQKKVLEARYPSFFTFVKKKFKELTQPEKKDLTAGYRKIVADALLLQEMKKIERHTAQTPGSFVENTLLQMLGLGSIENLEVRRQRHQAEMQVVKTLLEGQGLAGKELENMRSKLEEAKLEGRLLASGVPKEQVKIYQQVIQTVQVIYDQMLVDAKDYKGQLNLLPEGQLKQMRQWLLETKANWFDKSIEQEVSEKLKALTQPNAWNELVKKSPDEVATEILEPFESYYGMLKSGYLNEYFENGLKPYIEFHNKWKHRLQGEMIQGVVDKQEAFGDGVCTGVGSRWAINDQRHPKASVQELCDPAKLKVSATDRLLQGFTSMAFRLKHFIIKTQKDRNESLIEKTFPEGFKKTLGIQKAETMGNVSGTYDSVTNKYKQLTDEQLQAFETQIKGQKKLEQSNGVMPVRLDFAKGGAHLIYLRYDPKQKPNVFRLGEPIAGILEFPNEKEFFECFKDLCKVYYRNEEVNEISTYQFTA